MSAKTLLLTKSQMLSKAQMSNKEHTSSTELNEYLNNLYDSNNINNKLLICKMEKVDSKTMCIPNINDYKMMTQYNYTVPQLKTIITHYKLKISGNKNQLLTRIYSFLYFSSYIIKIQKVWQKNKCMIKTIFL